MNKVWLWSAGYFSLLREVLQKPSKNTWSNTRVEYLIATLFVPFENMQVIYVNCKCICKRKFIFLFFGNLETWSQIPVSKWKTHLHIFLLLIGPCSASIPKCIQLFVINWVSTAPSPCPVFNPDSSGHTQMCGCCERWVHTWALSREELQPESRPHCELCWAICSPRAGDTW